MNTRYRGLIYMDQNNRARSDGLFIPSRYVSAYVALGLVSSVGFFLAGYFLGKQSALTEFVSHIEASTLSDEVFASMCSLYEPEKRVAHQEVPLPHMLLHPRETEEDDNKHTTFETNAAVAPTESSFSDKKVSYYAQIIGYGTRKAATQFVQKMEKKGVMTTIKERKSVTAQGKESYWYQVVTMDYSDLDTLTVLTERIAREEKIQGIKIATS